MGSALRLDGRVARELNLLVQASERRRTVGQAEEATTPDQNQVRRLYRRLLDLVDAEVAIDVLAGTSAGGINSVLLGLVNARGLDLAPLRDIWFEAGDFGKLMRDPAEQSPPSLLKGDGQMLAALNSGIARLLAQSSLPAGTPGTVSSRTPETDVFITTTLLSPETGRFTDDYGTEIEDTDHHGLFHFTTSDLTSGGIGPSLALAARSSASFPAAFEPSFLPFGQPAVPDPQHPDMSPFSNATRAHWAADGGLLANRPIAPLLQRVFNRSADREVRRALLYVVPSTGPSKTSEEDRRAKPLGLAEALRQDLGATLNQSIAADLAAIKEHNDRVGSAADTGRRMAALGSRLGQDQWLSDRAAWRDYGTRQGDWIVAPLVAELSRQMSTLAGTVRLPAEWQAAPALERDIALRSRAREVVMKNWPKASPGPQDVVGSAVALGRPAFESAKATLLRMLRLGRVVATTLQQRNFLAEQGKFASRPLSDAAPGSIRVLVQRELDARSGPRHVGDMAVVGERRHHLPGRHLLERLGRRPAARGGMESPGEHLPKCPRVSGAAGRRCPGARARDGSVARAGATETAARPCCRCARRLPRVLRPERRRRRQFPGSARRDSLGAPDPH